MTNFDRFAKSAYAVADLLDQVGDWSGPGLGSWDIRALAGHTSRAVTTPVDYLRQGTTEAPRLDAIGYLAAATSLDPAIHAGVAARGVEAGEALGPEPAARFRQLVDDACATLADAGNPALPTIVGPMHLDDYLATRIFELVIHGSDLEAATGIPIDMPPEAVTQVAVLAVSVAAARHRGLTAARALTGRDGSPFSIF